MLDHLFSFPLLLRPSTSVVDATPAEMQAEMCSLLLEADADPHQKDGYGDWPSERVSL